ncbi:PaaI family thioesterase [Tateyamaria sp.]|uniref:PaaI family thioesterase n=1 Tax=Tateyamaria sp. TaxID=1929288 RepID=UPI003B21B93E
MNSQPPDPPGIIRDETGAQTLLGYVVDITAQDGTARCILDIEAQHGNRHGSLHGGDTRFMTISMNTQFMAPARSGRVVATGSISGGGRSLLFAEGEVVDENGTVIATATGVYKRVREGGS